MAGLLGSVFLSYLLCSTKPTILLPPEGQQKQNKTGSWKPAIFKTLHTRSIWLELHDPQHHIYYRVYLSLLSNLWVWSCFWWLLSYFSKAQTFPMALVCHYRFHVKIIWKSNNLRYTYNCHLFVQSLIGATDTCSLNYFMYFSRILLKQILNVL